MQSLTITNTTRTAEEPKQEPIIKEVINEVPVVKIIEVEKKKVLAPEYFPAYTCSQGCNHTNPNYRKRVRGKCNNCDQFSKSDSSKCAWCGSDDIEPIDKEELEDVGIPLPNPYNNYSESYSCPSSHCDGIRHSI